jgi:hypothetical protein
MNEDTVQKYPTLTNDERLAIREAQFVLTNTKEQALAAVQAAEKNLLAVVETLGKKYELDPTTTQIDSRTLEFMDAK